MASDINCTHLTHSFTR